VPNTYLPAQQYIELTLARLLMAQHLGGLITPYSGEEFVGTLNDTLIYRTPGVTIARDYEFRTRTAPIIFDEVYRNTLSLTLDSHMTVGNRWTDEERKFDLTSLDREIATPMGEAMVRRFDGKILARLKAADWAVTTLDGTEPDPATEKDNAGLKIALAWKAKLDAIGCPANGRILALGANPAAYFAASPSTLKYDPAQALTVFRQGVFGRIANFELFDGTQELGENEIIALHPSWAVLPNAAPENPESLKFSVRQTVGGYSARMAAQYDLSHASDRLLLNTFWGVSEIKDQYARHTTQTAAAANDGSVAGDIIIADGRTTFTGKNARGGKGVWTPDT
jgi:hypothetical protein